MFSWLYWLKKGRFPGSGPHWALQSIFPCPPATLPHCPIPKSRQDDASYKARAWRDVLHWTPTLGLPPPCPYKRKWKTTLPLQVRDAPTTITPQAQGPAWGFSPLSLQLCWILGKMRATIIVALEGRVGLSLWDLYPPTPHAVLVLCELQTADLQ